MILAKLLLQSTRTPIIAKIASHVGYDDQMYFSRVFRKRVGTVPANSEEAATRRHAFCEIPDDAGRPLRFDLQPLPGDTPMGDTRLFPG